MGNSTGIRFPSTSSFSRFHAACEGHPASDGRRRTTAPTLGAFRGSAGPASRLRFFAAPHSSRAHNGPSAAIPDCLKNVLLSIELGTWPRLAAILPSRLSAPSYIKGYSSPGHLRLRSTFQASPQLIYRGRVAGSAGTSSGTYIAEPDRGRRKWAGKRAEQAALYGNRQRIGSHRGKQLLRRRGELVEQTFAHAYETGALRRLYVRGRENGNKRLL